MLRFVSIFLVLSIFDLFVRAHCNECEMERERAEDWKIHGCRSCKSMPVEFEGNCPKRGYDCDEALKMRTNVLGTDSCECSQLKCKDGNASLAIKGELFTRVTCVDKEWSTPTKLVAESGICARKCDRSICRTHPEEYFKNNPTYVPFVVNPPDSEHSCAWGNCPFGAIASDWSGDHSYNSAVEFSCAGDRRWQDPSGNRHDRVACLQKECEPLGTETPAIFCKASDSELPAKYKCYVPQQDMKCHVPKALRDSTSDTILAPICSNGKWKSSEQDIAKDTKVMCVACPELPFHSSQLGSTEPDSTMPTYEGTQVTCPSTMVLNIRIGSHLGDPAFPVFIPIETMRCSDDIIWETNGGNFQEHGYGSLAELVEKVRDPNSRVWVAAICI